MRTHVTFRFAAEFVGAQEDEGILGVRGVSWFTDRLTRVPRLALSPKLIQEDWGVAFLAERDGSKFWIGLSVFEDGVWIAHIHNSRASWLRGLFGVGPRNFSALAGDLNHVLAADALVSDIRWYNKDDLKRMPPTWKPNPADA